MSIHIDGKRGDIAETILLPGDPLRARFVADTYLDNAVCYTKIRNVLDLPAHTEGNLFRCRAQAWVFRLSPFTRTNLSMSSV